jgi:hypothetical protein
LHARSTAQGSVVKALLCVSTLLTLAACGSGTVTHDRGIQPPTGNTPPGGTNPPGGLPNPPPPPPPVTSVTLNGIATFDLVPYAATLGSGLDYAATTQAPARNITVELLDESDNVVATTVTDATGSYQFADIDTNTVFKLRMKAELSGSGVQVLDNTNSDALYSYTSNPFTSGALDPIEVNVNAPSGWTTAYTAPRFAAPFAILDAVYQAQQYVGQTFPGPALKLFWSEDNTDSGDLDTDRATGGIETTQYRVTGGGQPEIYILGDADNDTDEYDRDVIIQHFAYHYLATFSRDDSIGGDFEENLDPRNAYSEGFARAFPAMVTGSGLYRDTSGANQGMEEDPADIETGVVGTPGWFNPYSIASIFYDLVDTNADGTDTVSLPFSELHASLVQAGDTPAFATIYPFLTALFADQPALTTQLSALIGGHGVLAGNAAPDDFGTNETNNGGNPAFLPIYTRITADSTNFRVLSYGDVDNYYNALANRRFLIYTPPANTSTATIRAFGVDDPANDPDIDLYRGGELIGRTFDGARTENLTTGDNEVDEPDYFEIPMPPLEAGTTYVIEVFESGNVFPDDPVSDYVGPTNIDVQIVP